MKIGTTNNNNAAFGSFKVGVPNDKDSLKTLQLVNRIVKQNIPDVNRKLAETKKTPGFIKNIVAWVFELKGKNVESEVNAANCYAQAGFTVTPVMPSPKERAQNALNFLKANAKAAKQPAPTSTPQDRIDEFYKQFKPVFDEKHGQNNLPPDTKHQSDSGIMSKSNFDVMW